MIKTSYIGPRRRGTVAVFVAISLTVLMMILAVTLDGGLLFAEKRHAQAVADAAALAGAADLFKNYSKNTGADPSGTASASALAIAANNAYTNDGVTSSVVARSFGNTYLSGPNVGKAIDRGYIEVNVTYHHPRYFSQIFGSGAIPIKARAVGYGTWSIPKFGLLALDPTKTGLRLVGNGVVSVESGIIQVNSSDATSAVKNLNNATILANEIDILGGMSGAGTIITSPTPNNVNYNVPPTPDPLWSLPAPTQPATSGNVSELKDVGKNQEKTDMFAQLLASGITLPPAVTNIYVAEPGTYDGKGQAKFPPSLGNSDLVLFKPGIYYLKDYGLNLSNSALLMYPGTTAGMMFYIDPSKISDGLNITGNGTNPVHLTGVTSGPYQGMIIFQSRTATVQPDIAITGNGNFFMEGTIYAANGTLKLTGNGAGNNIASALIARTVELGGNGEIIINLSSGKVAPQRVIRLVE